MNNLIVTLIAISLTAMVGIMTIHYGGNAYVDSQIKSRTVKYTNYMNNYAAAIKLWSLKNGSTFPRPSVNYPSSCSGMAYCSASDLKNILGPKYIGAITTPEGVDDSMMLYWNETGGLMENPVLLLRMTSSDNVNPKTCTDVEKIRQGTAPSDLRTYGDGTANLNRYMCGKVGCIKNDGTFGSASTYPYIAYVRLGSRPDLNAAEETTTNCLPVSSPPPPPPPPDPDTTPDPFNVGPDNVLYLLALGTVSSNPVTPTGYDTQTTISIACTSCANATTSYRINGGAWTSAAGTINPGDSVQVRITPTPVIGLGTKKATLTIGGISDTYTVIYVLSL